MLGERQDRTLKARTLELRPSQSREGGGPEATSTTSPLARRLARGEARALLSFGGQGSAWWVELAAMVRAEPWLAEWVERASAALGEFAATQAARWSGLYAEGTDLLRWLGDERPSEAYLASTPISLPAIFLTQLARFEVVARRGLEAGLVNGGIVGALGFSQGLAAAACVAGRDYLGEARLDQVVGFVGMLARVGFHVADATRELAPSVATGSPMRVVIGPTTDFLKKAIAQVPGVAIAQYNDRKRHVLSGDPRALDAAQLVLEKRCAAEAEARKAGRRGGNSNTTVAFEAIATSAMFHTKELVGAVLCALSDIDASGFTLGELAFPVFDPGSDVALDASPDPLRALVASLCLSAGHWQKTVVRAVTEVKVDALLDFGVGDGIARLTAGCLRGSGVDTFALTEPRELERLFSGPTDDRPVRYADFMPTLAKVGDQVVVDNRFARATGMPPVILPGMTPTTVDAGIVAAAANAGFCAELAGGGQVSERIFDERLAELSELLAPGVGIVFNALLLDAYLWGMHLGTDRLVQKARAAGHPILGVTVSAGIPPIEKAVALLDELAALGMTLNAFKPGTKQQIEEVIAIAKAAPRHTLFVHIEGGKAGGHHSWEDLDELLLETYHQLRSQPNVVVCVGGGIADEARGVALLDGSWSTKYGVFAMPVDAIFLGTIAMACREATATTSVKDALVAANGTDRWVGRGVVEAGITSGRSQLDADIHYLENAAAKCGRLLDSVAGDADAVAAKRPEIIAALAQTAKPYFGDVATMSWHAIITRAIALMAIADPSGASARYEDGPWLDRTWRLRVLDVMRRAEARLAGLDGCSEPFASCVSEHDLDDPHAALVALAAKWPAITEERPQPIDTDWLVYSVWARPGKPVPFVPVIDRDVRRWYKSDSLWQAQHPRYRADETLVIPGPEAAKGITRADEPVAELLQRFARALVTRLGDTAVERASLPSLALSELPDDVAVRETKDGIALVCGEDVTDGSAWLDWLATRFDGPLAALLGEGSIAEGTRFIANPARRLLRASPGASIDVTLDGNAITTVGYRDPSGETLTLTRDAHALTLALPALVLPIAFAARGGRFAFTLAPGAFDAAIAELYAATLFESRPTPVAPFEEAFEVVTLDKSRARAYARTTGRRDVGTDVPNAMVFSIAWPAIYRTIACDELVGGLLRLVHLENDVTPLEGTLALDRDAVVRASVTRIEDHADSRRVLVTAHIQQGLTKVRLDTAFHIRGPVAHLPSVRAFEHLTLDLDVTDPARRTFLAQVPGIALPGLQPPAPGSASSVTCHLTLDARVAEQRGPEGVHYGAAGRLMKDGEQVGTVAIDTSEGAEHPLRALAAVLAPKATQGTPKKTLAELVVRAPSDMTTFAEVGGDLNPIHRSPLVARLAGLDAPIVHGMWTAARLHAFVVDALASGDARRVTRCHTRFLAPVLPGEALVLRAARVAVEDGALTIEATALLQRSNAPVAVAKMTLTPPPTAWVFPGQGIQQRDMGMAGFGRSAAARKVWERADAHTKSALGFSILRVVRENPTELTIRGERLTHAQGVLNLTQLTQVAMATLAQAQVAELREANAWSDDAALCGHSVGEYNALAAAANVLPLEAVLSIVYQRGRVMHGLVPRDANGESGYGMGVIRPHRAGLDHAGAEALVAKVRAETGRFLEIVNYNLRGRQYSVTGHVDALATLERALPAGKSAYVPVPGIDVPFHSQALRGGVPDFKAALEKHLPLELDAQRLIGRYIPNLVARPFELTVEFTRLVRDAVGGASRDELDAVLMHWTDWSNRPNQLARALVVELLAWQFASPVRWIETQDVLFGELGIERLVEVGVGYQPTLANLAKATLEKHPTKVEVINIEADRAKVFHEDLDTEPAPAAASSASAPAPAPATSSAPAPATATATATTKPADAPLTQAEALVTILALQAKVRPDQIARAETIDGLFDGVSSRRNQVLVDIGAEFDLGTIDRANETPLGDFTAEVEKRSRRWKAPGAYLAHAHDDALKKALGRSGLATKDAVAYLEAEFGFGPGLVTATFDTLALEARSGQSARGGDLGRLGDAPANKDAAKALLAKAVELLGQRRNTSYGRLGSTQSTTSVVDSAALGALSDRLDNALLATAQTLAQAANRSLTPAPAPVPAPDPALAILEAELGAGFATLVAPAFDAHRHVAFGGSWMPAHRDLVRACFDRLNDRISADAFAATLTRLAPHASHPRLADAAKWFGRYPALAALATFAAPATPGRFVGRCALVTGASPSSIAEVIVAELLRGGATVVATTSNASRERIAFYRRLFEKHATPSAELHVVPFNQASFGDQDALVDWLFRVETEQAGAAVRVLKPALVPDLIVPFAALKDQGSAAELGPNAEAGLRAMVLGTERLVATIAKKVGALGIGTKTHVVLPLSPNHGAFGGDGAYAESKAAIEVLLNKHKSEKDAWASHTTMVGARIGWVRGTGLMAHNDRLAPKLEAATGMRTYSTQEMGALLANLCSDEARREQPYIKDLTGGFADVPDLKAAVEAVKSELQSEASREQGLLALAQAFAARLSHPQQSATLVPLPPRPAAPATAADLTIAWPAQPTLAPEDMVVIVGVGEVSPGGTSRTRFELEVSDRLSAPAVLELAWMTGLVRFETSPRGGSWIDVATSEVVPEADIGARYHDRVRQGCGIRFTEPDLVGFDPARAPVMERVYLEKDLSFRVGSEAEARSFAAADPHAVVVESDGSWLVTKKAGSELRVPREVKLTRRVAGQLPTGFDLGRFGIPSDMLESVDRVALMNLVATVDAFVAAGTTPEELLRHVHPARVGTTQSSGMGGMRSLHRLYVDHLLGRDRQSDILQETLINVVFAYAQTAYVGGYGPVSNPVAACATAALSIEDACDKIRLGKADVVMTGGWDDLSHEGVLGFGDMSATADTEKLAALGLAPDQMSRANDRRRKGFVEAQGGGVLILARGDVALAMGLPVYGVVAYSGSFSDGINRSIPAPGIGALGAVAGGKRSPLAKALAQHGLSIDDVAVVSKHDTSTLANDPNESGLHQTINDTLGRTPGNPLLVVSQKALLGHAKGGAAAWQAIGLCQVLASGVVPGNRNLDSIDPAFEGHGHLLYTNEALRPGAAVPLRAGVLTSLGFGHVSALVCLVHPAAFVQALPDEQREAYLARAAKRRAASREHWSEVLLGKKKHFEKRQDRRFAAADGSDAQKREETAMLIDPDARLREGTFGAARGDEGERARADAEAGTRADPDPAPSRAPALTPEAAK